MECICIKCGGKWKSRLPKPNLCRYCKTKYWNIPKRMKQIFKDDILTKRIYSKVIAGLIKFRNRDVPTPKTQIEFAKFINEKQPNISNPLATLYMHDYIHPKTKYRINERKIAESFLSFLKDELIKENQEREQNISFYKDNINMGVKNQNTGKTKTVSWEQWNNKMLYDIEQKYSLKNKNLPKELLQPPKEFIEFLMTSLCDFIENLYDIRKAFFAQYSLEDIFTQYLDHYLNSVNLIAFEYAQGYKSITALYGRNKKNSSFELKKNIIAYYYIIKSLKNLPDSADIYIQRIFNS